MEKGEENQKYHFRAVKLTLELELKKYFSERKKKRKKETKIKTGFCSVTENCGFEGVYSKASCITNRPSCIVEVHTSVAKASFHHV